MSINPATRTLQQIRFYQWTFDIWDVSPSWDPSQGDPYYSIVYSGQPAMYIVTPEYDDAQDTGLTQTVNIFSLDQIRFPIGTLTRAGQYFKMVSAPDSLATYPTLWWNCRGNNAEQALYSKSSQVYAKRVFGPPPGAS